MDDNYFMKLNFSEYLTPHASEAIYCSFCISFLPWLISPANNNMNGMLLPFRGSKQRI